MSLDSGAGSVPGVLMRVVKVGGVLEIPNTVPLMIRFVGCSWAASHRLVSRHRERLRRN
jgi:hypothetical protein